MDTARKKRLEKVRKKVGRNQWPQLFLDKEVLQWKNGDNGERKSGSGRPRKTTAREGCFLIREAVSPRSLLESCQNTSDLARSLQERTVIKYLGAQYNVVFTSTT